MNSNPLVNTELNIQYELPETTSNISKLTKEQIFQSIRTIKDPEHEFSLEQLNVVSVKNIFFEKKENIKILKVLITPTIPHCSMAAIIGLCVLYKLNSFVNDDIKNYTLVVVEIEKDTHNNYKLLNKQLSDKERVRAAFENNNITRVINECINWGV